MVHYIECDRPFHELLKQCKTVLFRELDANHEYYYAEECLYAIRNKKTGVVSLVYSKSPLKALEKLMEVGKDEKSKVDDFC